MESIRKSDETREYIFAVAFRYGMFQCDSIVMIKKMLQTLLKMLSITFNE